MILIEHMVHGQMPTGISALHLSIDLAISRISS